MRLTLPLAALFALSLVARGEELRIIGKHELEGRDGTRAFGGWIEILPDATYRGERRFQDGSVEQLSGDASIDVETLVLRDTSGLISTLGGAPADVRRYERDGDEKRRPRWKLERPGLVERLIQAKKPEPEWIHLLKRVTVEGCSLNWLLGDNLGTVDDHPGGLILRSKLPSPGDIVKLQDRRGLKTIISLNGDQDREATLWRDTGPGSPPAGSKVNVKDFIRARGIEHVVVRMSADEGPTDAELVTVFSALLDDAKKPVLIHCKGGSDRTGIICAVYAHEFLNVSKADAKKTMRRHLWAATSGTEIQGAYLDLYRKGTIKSLLTASGYVIPQRYR